MAITKIKGTSSFTNLTKYDSFLAGNAAYNPSSYESIATITATGGETSLAFTSISGSYSSLQIRSLVGDTDTGGYGLDLYVRFNSDSGNNYAYHRLRGNGSTASATGNSAYSYIILGSGNIAATDGNIRAAMITDIHDYASTTKAKTVRSFAGNDANTASTNYRVDLSSGLWTSTSAITRIDFYAIGGTAFRAGSTFALYGIKGA